MLLFKATLRWWDPDHGGDEGRTFKGTIRLKDFGGTIVIQSEAVTIELPNEWMFSSHKLKSANSRARVVLLQLGENGIRIQLTMGISDSNDAGKAVVEFFKRAGAGANNNK